MTEKTMTGAEHVREALRLADLAEQDERITQVTRLLDGEGR